MKLKNHAYKSWEINPSDYPASGSVKEQISFLLGFAVLAPSTFNAQPWKCLIQNHTVNIYLDLKRMPTVSDKEGRFAHISVGCFIENLVIAAAHYGWDTKTEFHNRHKSNKKLLASISFRKSKEKDANDNLFNAITLRATNRSIGAKEISKGVRDELLKHVGNRQKLVLLDTKHREKIIAISLKGDKNIWTQKEFRKEHVQWVRNNLTRKHDGMPGFGVGVKLIPSFFAKPIILSNLFAKMQARKNVRSLQHTAHFGILCCPDSDRDWVKIGMLFERLALYLTIKGIAVAPMGQFVEDNEARKDLQEILRPHTQLPPQIFFRLGYPLKGVKHSPRFKVEHVILEAA